MPHPARPHLSLSLTLSLDDADELTGALAKCRNPSPRLRALRAGLDRSLRSVEWTRIADTPPNHARLVAGALRAEKISV